MKEELQEKEVLSENNNEANDEINEYKLSYYKWGSYCFKAAFIVCIVIFLVFIRNLLK